MQQDVKCFPDTAENLSKVQFYDPHGEMAGLLFWFFFPFGILESIFIKSVFTSSIKMSEKLCQVFFLQIPHSLQKNNESLEVIG